MFSKEFRYVFYLFQASGVSPFSIDYRTNTVTKSTSMRFYTLLLIFVSILILISGCINPDVIPDFAELSRLFTDVAVFILTFVTLFIILIQSIRTHSEQIQLLALLNEIDFTLMTKLHYDINIKRVTRNAIAMCIVIMIFYVIQESLSLFVMIQLNQYFAYWYHIIIAIMISGVRTIQFVFFMEMIQARMGMLNECVKECIEQAPETMEYFAREILQTKLRQQRLKTQFCVIKGVFEKIVEVHRLSNEVFGNSMLMIVLQIFIFLCTNTYWSILQHTVKISTIFPLDPLMQIVSLSVRLFIVVDRCTKCQSHVS